MMRISEVKLHRASMSWYCRLNGKWRYLTRKGGTREEAELARAKLVIEQNGKAPGCKSNDDVPLNQLFELYEAKIEKTISAGSLRQKKQLHKEFLAKFVEKTVLTITRSEIQDWIQSHEQWEDGTKLFIIKLLHAAFRWMSSNLGTTVIPTFGIARPRAKVRSEECILEPGEFDRLLSVVFDPLDHDILTILWASGARPSEVLFMTGEEYSAKDHAVHKKHHKTARKGKKRTILLTDEAEAIVLDRIASHGTGLLFITKKGKPMSPEHLNNRLHAYCRTAGLRKEICPYSFRHSFAVRNLEAGTSLSRVAAWLGNTVGVCEHSYAHAIERVANSRALIV